MSRYAQMFERLKQRNEGAFGAFLMLGDPDKETSAALLDTVVEAGADMVEVGIPFSDPVADGCSGLSPYLHFGQISPLEIALRVAESDAPRVATDSGTRRPRSPPPVARRPILTRPVATTTPRTTRRPPISCPTRPTSPTAPSRASGGSRRPSGSGSGNSPA